MGLKVTVCEILSPLQDGSKAVRRRSCEGKKPFQVLKSVLGLRVDERPTINEEELGILYEWYETCS
jgi:hypothetical protein